MNGIYPCKACDGNGFKRKQCGCRSAVECTHESGFWQRADRERAGIYCKFWVRRTDGSSENGQKHADCDYFVLDWVHDPFAIPAALAYAKACEAEYPELARDLRTKVERAKHGAGEAK